MHLCIKSTVISAWKGGQKLGKSNLCCHGTFDNYDILSPFLDSAWILKDHCAYELMKEGHILFFVIMVGIFCSAEVLNGPGMNPEGTNMWKEAKAEVNLALHIVYRAKEKQKLEVVCYTVLHRMENPLILTERIQTAT